MKMKLRFLSVLVMACVGSAAYSADPTDRLLYYQTNIRDKESGVYEHDGDLYVHVKKGVKASATMMRVRMKAIGEMNDLLRRWAIDYASSNAVRSAALGCGLSAAVRALDAANPLWRYSDWKYQAGGQEFTGNKAGLFWICQVVKKDVVVKQIPASFYCSTPSTNKVISAISTFLPAMLKADSRRAYEDVGALDLCDFKIADESLREEKKRVDDDLAEYRSGSFYLSVKSQHDVLATPVEDVTWQELPGKPEETHSETCSLLTNVIVNAVVVTNLSDRCETDEECASLGISEGKTLHEAVRVSDEMEIVETRTVTTVTTTKRIRKKVVKSIFGTPRFEQIFLSGGVASNALAAQTASGAAAAKTYGSASVKLEEREKAVHDALRENPGDILLWNMYGRCLMTRGDTVGALICFRAAAALDKNDQFALTNLAEAYENVGCHRLACAYAILGVGLAKSDWCKEKCRDLLLK